MIMRLWKAFSILCKVEIDYYTHHFKTKKELIKRMENWIKYYNQERIRHKKKSLIPIEYRNQALKAFI
ncbi:IS3 family transposase [Lactobacillus johnsonii]|uniref:IS3 family transposase n=1 Tax=Lactobacillus johnsonii TaxID=33959 RepID=A0A9X7U016_LACJH|nr:IS3 family transposase [Lactobacillus johnsonii]